MLPDRNTLSAMHRQDKGDSAARDIVVNINQDDRRNYSEKTLLSDRDSLAKGYITEKKGDRWLNNSRYFSRGRGRQQDRSGEGKNDTSGKDENIILSKLSEVVMQLRRKQEEKAGGLARIAIPDKNSITRENAIFYSNSGMFSFNTAKFKNFDYFRKMKDKIASNWFPPDMANAVIGGYAPGRTRIMAIPSQVVKTVFIMNRQGDVVNVRLMDSKGNRELNKSCLDAIRLSETFGPVPDSIEGEYIVIPFMFGFYVN